MTPKMGHSKNTLAHVTPAGRPARARIAPAGARPLRSARGKALDSKDSQHARREVQYQPEDADQVERNILVNLQPWIRRACPPEPRRPARRARLL
eukprot:1581594-Pyramimonas_sp.AAC.1